MNILSVDTSTEAMALCLARGTEDNLFERFETRTIANGAQHSESLVPQMLELCKHNGLILKDLDLLVCTNGPGSFTGLRIGMSACKGVALAASIPLVSISTLDALYECVSFFNGAVVPAIDARKKRFYTAIYADGKRQTPDLDCDGDEIAKLLEGHTSTLVTGPDAVAFSHQLKNYDGALFVDGNPSANLALTLIRLGFKKFRDNGPDDIGTGPAYVRKSDAELALLEKIRKLEEING
ncbi:universal bacterial protein YeaZ [Sphaerochaeta pleomorpha str. Grapes]|uniref:Universal bacterial protein YeaZ n=1 Tax=Sphaerochaeta pleomorpha (strain ATCC BAA-1885 / DSM 22778 / Grapes) TaxID=158190 RepID=G8QYH1_SPHPG|nr:tRNA (adenosine(37)-N6)-threonylcarbamoyltransferase complex dimerization subunit type 1 TsaB [Sphaerochaeta pleomorpha]AEV30818.1 universal bacterial protein YeaZ [Sphaerochaeta pleomorpha str. Grapes]